MATIKKIKKDAIVKVNLGTGFIQKLQELLMFIANQHTTDELVEFRDIVSKKETLKDWMEHLTTISVLIREFETKAQEQGFIIDSPVSDDEPVIIEEDN